MCHTFSAVIVDVDLLDSNCWQHIITQEAALAVRSCGMAPPKLALHAAFAEACQGFQVWIWDHS
jgi:hypothetical protein